MNRSVEAVPDVPSWLDLPAHRGWATGQALDLLRFFSASMGADGWSVELDDDGRALPTGCPPALAPRQSLMTVTRLIHCYALGELLGVPGCATIIDRGLGSLWQHHRDPAHGGYIEAVGRRGPYDTTKAAIGHAHVLLAATSALAAGHSAAQAVFDDVLAVIDEHFWSEQDGATSENYDGEWHELEAYRGANSNMHLCEALLAAAAVASRPDLATRAELIARKFIDGFARANGWLLPEHFSLDWAPLLDYNRDQPDHPFRPYGATPGHSLEWARLVLKVQLAIGERDARLLEASEALFDRAVTAGWDDDRGGLVYTVDWDGAPANSDHYWWPIAEGIAASAYLARTTRNPAYETWYRRFWDYAADHLIDHQRGGWFPMLDANNRPKVYPWYGKPDIYHCLHACLLPIMPLASSVAGAVRAGNDSAVSPRA